MTTPATHRENRSGFTLLEVMAACAVLALVLVVGVGMLGGVSDLWLKQRGKSAAFEGASAAYARLTRSLAQATLNTYWGYVPEGSAPTDFQRKSELHFQMGSTSLLLGQPADRFPGMGVFFQAPEGRTTDANLKRLPSLLNGVGFFTVFGDAPNVPPILDAIVPPKPRFRLMEWQEPVEDVAVYESNAGNAWFASRVVSGTTSTLQNTAILAENIVTLILLAEYPTAAGTQERSYIYDSRDTAAPARLNQLPPQIHVLMLAISETSATRLAEKYDAEPPPLLPAAGLFTDASKFESDIKDWEDDLQDVEPPVDYLLFNSVVNIKSAKWSL